MTDLLRVYLDPSEISDHGYPFAWYSGPEFPVAIKDYVRQLAGYRCVRCGHPYPPGITETCPRGEWTPCDEQCSHEGPVRHLLTDEGIESGRGWVGPQAQWRILTTHHLNGIKHDCRWWNLAALCQRCHLQIQGRVVMDRVYPLEHSEWFKPYAAGWYAWAYLGQELSREETTDRLEELLSLERVA